MSNNSIQVDLKDLYNKFDKFKKTLDDPSGVFTKTMSDMKSRAPGKVADAVRSQYSIKKADVMPTKQKKEGSLKKAGTIKVKGETVETFNLYYEGRVLTPLHFGVTPKKLQPHGKKYKVKLKVKKERRTVSSPTKEGQVPFVAPAKSGSSTILPWLREPDGTINPMKTVSLPQMVDNKVVREDINTQLGELLQTRFNHHMDRFLDKAIK